MSYLVMMRSGVDFFRTSIIRKSCLQSPSLLGSCINGVRPAITSLQRRNYSAIHTFKPQAMQKEEGERRFPPQHQDSQPGKEYLMDPLPQYANPNYKGSGKLHGKVALVTGGDSGIGRSVCYHFAKEGATIAFTYVKGVEDIDANESIKIINEVRVEGSSDPIAIPTDLGYDNNCKEVVDEVISKYGCIDILVNHPAVQYYTYSDSLDEISEERLEKVFRTNIFSYFFMSRHALKYMKGGSKIINTTSVLAYIPDPPSWLDYSSTKGAILAFTRGLALHLVDKNIRVNGVAPGPIWTPLQASALNDSDIARYGSTVPMNRAGQPYEVAPAYVFLASEDSSYFTGQVLHPNGGVIVNG
ncbi:glucose and ribitol dehydrogenase-like [Rutidosis leptorrhynchoides]|uniref:glucose and ribitol dehydrogenase-like n=1 Tax=Rutidosis leptorrhynchoides TaxID=125765 RepID=UPI003A9A3993